MNWRESPGELAMGGGDSDDIKPLAAKSRVDSCPLSADCFSRTARAPVKQLHRRLNAPLFAPEIENGAGLTLARGEGDMGLSPQS